MTDVRFAVTCLPCAVLILVDWLNFIILRLVVFVLYLVQTVMLSFREDLS